MTAEPCIVSAAAVLPIAGPCIPHGAVVIAGNTILAVGPLAELQRDYAGARATAYPDCVLLPGFVNAHTHLELSFLRGQLPRGNFVDWVIALIGRVPRDPATRATVITAAVRQGIAECLSYGVTTIGDISRQVDISRPVLAAGPLRAVSFGEVQGLGALRDLFPERLAAARAAAPASATLTIGLSPHAPYSIEGPLLRQTVDAAAADGLPLCMHLAELRQEAEFLATLGGDLRRIWEFLGDADALLDQAVPRFACGPIRWAQHWGLLDSARRPLLAHVNYADDAELDILAQAGAAVAYCPRTRQFFDHDAIAPHRWRAMQDRDINVCLATDSLASNPDLSVLREAQTFLELFPTTPSETILELITRNPAHALGLENLIGTLESGHRADLIALPLPAPTPTDQIARTLITTAPPPRAVWIGGVMARGR